jgi:hypothetical protein
MSLGAQNRSKDAKTPSGSRGRSDKPEPDRCPVQPYFKAAKKRATDTTTEQGTPQDKERLKITPTIQDTQDKKSSIGGPRQTTGNQFQRSMNGTTKKSLSKVTMTMGTLC